MLASADGLAQMVLFLCCSLVRFWLKQISELWKFSLCIFLPTTLQSRLFAPINHIFRCVCFLRLRCGCEIMWIPFVQPTISAGVGLMVSPFLTGLFSRKLAFARLPAEWKATVTCLLFIGVARVVLVSCRLGTLTCLTGMSMKQVAACRL